MQAFNIQNYDVTYCDESLPIQVKSHLSGKQPEMFVGENEAGNFNANILK